MMEERIRETYTDNEVSVMPRLDGISFGVLKKIIDVKSLHECVSYAAEILGNPVAIVDPAFCLMAYSHYEFGWDRGWDDLFHRGGYSYEYIASITNYDKEKMPELARGVPTIGRHAQSENRRVAVRIYSEDIMLGTLVVVEACQPFTSTDPELAYIFGKTAGHIIAEQRFGSRPRKYRSLYPLLMDRLDGIQNDQKAFEEVLEYIGLPSNSIYRVVLVDMSNYYIQKQSPDTLMDFLKTLAPKIQSLFYDGNILVLLPLWRIKNSEWLFGTLNQTLLSWGLCAAVSDKFHRPFDIPEYYRQAKVTLSLMKKLDGDGGKFLRAREQYSSLLFYHDLRFIDMVETVLSTVPDRHISSLCDGKMMEILEYDRIYGTKYMKTLWVYLNSDKNALKASLEMGVHRNTTNYRLRKIEELFNLDFTDSWMMFRIYSSYLIYLCYTEKQQKMETHLLGL